MTPLTSVISATAVFSLILTSCNQNNCYPGYKNINGNCIKEYHTNKKIEAGRTYFHKKYGIIKYQNNFWYDKNNYVIYELGQR